jgi:hypothetical protein
MGAEAVNPVVAHAALKADSDENAERDDTFACRT